MSKIISNTKNMLAGLAISLLVYSCVSYEYPDLGEGIFAEFDTSKGSFVSKLYYNATPLTSANFISLAEGNNPSVIDSLSGKPFYDGLIFHRVEEGVLIQGGDPLGTGHGHPGYKFKDEFPRDAKGNYWIKHDRKGVLSMANSGPDSNGSQFFISLKPMDWLDGKHSAFGRVVKGLNVLDSLKAGDTIKQVRIIYQGSKAESYLAQERFLAEVEKARKEEAEAEQRRIEQIEAFLDSKGYQESVLNKKGVRTYTKKEGQGKKISSRDWVEVHYTGYLENGKVFASSRKSGEPLRVQLDGEPKLITGWTEGLRGLSEGSEVVLFIPSYLAYGDEGYLNVIPEKANLVFEMEILKVD